MQELAREFFKKDWLIAGLLWVIAVSIFVLLRSQQYTDVDGALRCLDIYHRNELFFHGNNHLLYPAYIFFWHQLLANFFISAGDPIEYIKLSQLLIAVAAAGSIALLYHLCYRATGSIWLSLMAAGSYACTRAFFMQATNAAEPMLGLFWSLLAIEITIMALVKERATWLMIAGLSFGLAMASYQSMILIGVVALLLCLCWPIKRNTEQSANGYLIWLRAAVLGASTLLSILVIYAIAYWASGLSDLPEMIARFYSLKGANVYGAVDWQKFSELLPSLIFNILPPSYFALFDQVSTLLGYLAVAAILLCLIKYRAIARREWLALGCGLLGLLVTLLAPLYWIPNYDKLWLQPLALLFFISAVLLQILTRTPLRALAPALAICLFTIEISINMSWALTAAQQPQPAMRSAMRMAQMIKPDDLIIIDWDNVSRYYGSLYGYQCKLYSLPSAAEELGAAALSDLNWEIGRTRARGGRVYLLGLLDQTVAEWDQFLLPRGISYRAFQPYRNSTCLIERYFHDNRKISLYQLRETTKNTKLKKRVAGGQ